MSTLEDAKRIAHGRRAVWLKGGETSVLVGALESILSLQPDLPSETVAGLKERAKALLPTLTHQGRPKTMREREQQTNDVVRLIADLAQLVGSAGEGEGSEPDAGGYIRPTSPVPAPLDPQQERMAEFEAIAQDTVWSIRHTNLLKVLGPGNTKLINRLAKMAESAGEVTTGALTRRAEPASSAPADDEEFLHGTDDKPMSVEEIDAAIRTSEIITEQLRGHRAEAVAALERGEP